jgi:hypothetical protein
VVVERGAPGGDHVVIGRRGPPRSAVSVVLTEDHVLTGPTDRKVRDPRAAVRQFVLPGMRGEQ